MSVQPDESSGVPAWDTADRMRKALRESGVSVSEMATYLNVSTKSAGNWINGRIEPDARTMRLWALRCGVSLEWICHGDLRPCDYRPRGVPLPAGSRSRSNNMQSIYAAPIVIRAA
jgi:transcriptional regulator with XRE-family HTH domain